MADEMKLTMSPEDKKAASKASAKQTEPEAKLATEGGKPIEGAKTESKAEKAIVKEAAKEAKSKKDEKPKSEVILERRFTLTLIKAYAKPQTRRGPTALKMLRNLCARHMKSTPLAVKLDGKLAAFAAGPGGKRPAKHVTVNAQKDKTGMVYATLALNKPSAASTAKPTATKA